ncbi:hypothetical protein NE237_004822 [Protea cynaroides]|uniref:Uncharacterized protein n=1 Tax=Protea cynaroides TaxID=273540 RepID=A0A9Q0KJF4_9MAGN|nr:hypothetical protein NE237_004822 [Protea cynaroides]
MLFTAGGSSPTEAGVSVVPQENEDDGLVGLTKGVAQVVMVFMAGVGLLDLRSSSNVETRTSLWTMVSKLVMRLMPSIAIDVYRGAMKNGASISVAGTMGSWLSMNVFWRRRLI